MDCRLLEFKSVWCQPAQLNKIIYLQREREGFRSVSQLSQTTARVCAENGDIVRVITTPASLSPYTPPHPLLHLLRHLCLTCSLHFHAHGRPCDHEAFFFLSDFWKDILKRHYRCASFGLPAVISPGLNHRLQMITGW